MIKLYNGDCLEVMKEIPNKSIDMILCDLPYQVTKNKWDTIIPMNDYIIANDESLEKDEFYLKQFLKGLSKKEIDKIWKENKQEGLWSYYNRIIKDNGVILLFGQDIFSEFAAKLKREAAKWEVSTRFSPETFLSEPVCLLPQRLKVLLLSLSTSFSATE